MFPVPPCSKMALITVSLLSSGLAFAQNAPVSPTQPTMKDRLDQMISTVTGDPSAKADIDMKRVLDAMKTLNPKPIADLTPQEGRQQPTLTDGVRIVLEQQGKSTEPLPGVTVKDVTYKAADGSNVAAKIYTPDGATGPLPVIVYYRGGGWVIADLKVYDASPRAIAKMANAIVVSADYRLAPEHKFPAAHDDAIAAYKWVLENAKTWGGDASRIAVMGESAGGNLALNVAIAARDQKLQPPLHQVLVYPVAGVDMNTPSYIENENAKPLNKAMMGWFVKHALKNDADKSDPRLDLNGKANLAGLGSTTIILAQIDPLRSDGEILADKLRTAGVKVNIRTFNGVTHEFFGAGAAIGKALEAEMLVANELTAILSPGTTGSVK